MLSFYCIKRGIIKFYCSVKWSKIDSKSVFCGKTDRSDTNGGILDKWNKIKYKKSVPKSNRRKLKRYLVSGYQALLYRQCLSSGASPPLVFLRRTSYLFYSLLLLRLLYGKNMSTKCTIHYKRIEIFKSWLFNSPHEVFASAVYLKEII